MRITAKFNGRCAECGEPTLKDSEIEYVDKKAYHPACAPVETSGVDPDALGFLLHDEALQKDWTRTEE